MNQMQTSAPPTPPALGSPFHADDTEHNALWNAITACGLDLGNTHDFRDAAYDFLENTPRTSLVVELAKKLREHGWKIVPANNSVTGAR